ncbi:hypothetical protein XENTR_v10019649 [Xenopus tropicalis]|uniref:Cysteine-rich venom protein 1-like n=1 Tax=Xenopus tropicalis TaxID=8364 RepID=A0A8J0R3K2_XENTR|nr:cysteine-rich venom protein 1-like [Xenopus tropicalis]XP_031761953.1 cysteine-rich venom protein 1-like [Xenopus tropicalis]KAE8594457.1 hypothetical protein XENTR_v10019649 [Xenopus tropicalis]|eukprot:XP_004916465.1 PREDICTED: cysteine-rich venom protein 1-like [Xenopus tropicalis]
MFRIVILTLALALPIMGKGNDEECPPGKYFDACGRSCPPTCATLDRLETYGSNCYPSCVCMPGTVLPHEGAEQCVRIAECPPVGQ